MKTCPKCNTENTDNAVFCINCGSGFSVRQTKSSSFQSGTAIKANGAAGALICGIISLLPLCCLGIIMSIISVILGYKALNSIERNPELEGKGLASAGIIFGGIGFIVNIAIIILWFIWYFGYYY